MKWYEGFKENKLLEFGKMPSATLIRKYLRLRGCAVAKTGSLDISLAKKYLSLIKPDCDCFCVYDSKKDFVENSWLMD